MSREYLHAIREFELRRVRGEFPPTGSGEDAPRVLDIGAGTGHQASLLQSLGYRVTAVDLSASDYAGQRVFPVIDYDGRTLPLPDGAFDVVFSSNVLEHVPDIAALLREMHRVLAPGGVAIHVLPTPAWRWWTTFAHYPWVLLRAWQVLGASVLRRSRVPPGGAPSLPQRGTWGSLLWPKRHGERGVTLTEPYYYGARWWRATFAAAGFRVGTSYPTDLFYTGCMLFADRLPIRRRVALARWLGSACRVYVLRPQHPTSVPASGR
jgi:SAM-dependent methyltransferase